MSRDYAVLLVVLVSTVVGFFWRRTLIPILYYLWLGLLWLEVQVRKWRDRKGGKRGI